MKKTWNNCSNMHYKHFASITLMVAITIGTFGFLLSSKQGNAQTRTLKFMSVGDSITWEDGSYRCPLWLMLKRDGFTNIKFVGRHKDAFARCTDANYPFHNAFGGYNTFDIFRDLPGWMGVHEAPDVALIQIGTNNFWGGAGDPQGAVNQVRDTIGLIRQKNPNVTVLVAKITPVTDAAMNGKITQYVGLIPQVASLSTSTSPVSIVDLHTGYTSSIDNRDGVHPHGISDIGQTLAFYESKLGNKGSMKQAYRWYDAVKPVAARLSGQPVPPTTPAPPVVTAAPTITPTRRAYNGVTPSIPGKIEAENYDEGGSNVGYFDRSLGNNGGVYRTDDVDLESNRVGGTNVGWIEVGDWLTYTFNVGSSGTYQLSAQVAAAASSGRFDLSVDGQPAGSVTVPNSGNWFGWSSVNASSTINLTPGNHLLRVTAAAGSASGMANLDFISFATAGTNPPPPAPTSTPPTTGGGTIQGGIKVQGNKIVDSQGKAVKLVGVNNSGLEYACVGNNGTDGWGFHDGFSPTQTSINTYKSWNMNAIRITLNETCWQGINGVSPQFSGNNYRQEIIKYVNLLNQNGMVAILDAQWNIGNPHIATSLAPMPNRDNSINFWLSVNETFKGNNMVILDLHNEAFPNNNVDTVAAWQCWKDAINCTNMTNQKGQSFTPVGFQEIVTRLRQAGATQIILLSGVRYSLHLSRWLEYKPTDPLNNLAASWHAYQFHQDGNWQNVLNDMERVNQAVPVISGEIGNTDGGSSFTVNTMKWMDARGIGYLAWTWNTWGNGQALITNFNGTPTAYGQAIKNHFLSLPATPLPPVTPAPPIASTPVPTTPPIQITEDINRDGKVNSLDFGYLWRSLP